LPSRLISGVVPDTGYGTLIFAGMIGDATLFQRADHIEASCKPFDAS
jgi:glucose-6-phosphate 1-dehydrogenase